MSEKVLTSIRTKIAIIIQEETQYTAEQSAKIACNICNAIDWNNSALMHKDLRWITKRFLRTTQFA
jgi:hypothetical protein